MLRNITATLFALSLIACGNIEDMGPQSSGLAGKGDGDQFGPNVTITEDMNGQTVTVSTGEEVKVWLASNPSTGYSWNLLTNSRSLPLIDSGFVGDDDQAQQAPIGSGGHEYFIFRPDFFVANKTLALRFEYAQQWEGGEVSRDFSVTLKVEQKCQQVMCALFCEYGFKTNEQGCPVCACADPFACTEDADCTTAKKDCCGCQMGGTSQAVNKNYASLFNKRCEIGGQPVYCLAYYNCFGQPACVNNRCELVAPPQ